MPNRDDLQLHQSSPSSRTFSGPAHPTTQASPPTQQEWPWEREVGPDGLRGLNSALGMEGPQPWDWSAMPLIPQHWRAAAEAFQKDRWERLDWLRNVRGLGLTGDETAWLLPVPKPDGEIQHLLIVGRIPPCPGDQLVLAQAARSDTPVMTVAVMWPAVSVPKDEYDQVVHGAQYWGEGPFLILAGKQVLAEFANAPESEPELEARADEHGLLPPPPPLN